LKSSWLPWYLLRPFTGMMLAILFYLVLWGGSHHDDSIASSNVPLWIIGVAGLVGLFTKQTTDKLDEVFSTLVKSGGDDKRKDKLDPNNLPRILPRITRVVATKRDEDSGVVTINVFGDRFTTGAVVRRDGSERKTTFTNANQLVAELRAEDVYQPGEIELQVVNPEPADGQSSSFTVTVHPGPRITGVKLDAEDCETGDGVAKIIVTGDRFVAGSDVECGKEGAVRETKFISRTKLHAYIHKTDRTLGEPSKVRVVNPLPSGDPSQWLRINTLPKITDLQWKPVDGKEDVTLVVKGSNFVNPVRLWYAGKEKTGVTTFVSGNELCAPLAPEDYKTAGSYRVKVCNPDPVGGAVELAMPNPVPTLTRVEPAEANKGTSVRLTITGSHFTPQTYVLFGEKQLTPKAGNWTETRLTVALNEADTPTVGEFSVTVVNPEPGGGRAESPQPFKVTP
jgi:IPT/TIG domain